MIAGKRYFGPGVDMWSLGVILFALICGYLPFEDANTAKLYEKIMGGDYEIPDFISQGGADLISKLLCTDPRKRYTAEQVRRHPWYASQAVKTDPQHFQTSMKDDPAFAAFYDNYSPDGQPVVDQEIIRHMAMIGYNQSQVYESIASQKHDHFSATYSLLLTKRRLAMLKEAKASAKGTDSRPPAHPQNHQAPNPRNIPPLDPSERPQGRNTKIPPLPDRPDPFSNNPKHPRPPSHPSSAGSSSHRSHRRKSRTKEPDANGHEKLTPRPPTVSEPRTQEVYVRNRGRSSGQNSYKPPSTRDSAKRPDSSSTPMDPPGAPRPPTHGSSRPKTSGDPARGHRPPAHDHSTISPPSSSPPSVSPPDSPPRKPKYKQRSKDKAQSYDDAPKAPIRTAFNVSQTSTKPPTAILAEMIRVVADNDLKYSVLRGPDARAPVAKAAAPTAMDDSDDDLEIIKDDRPKAGPAVATAPAPLANAEEAALASDEEALKAVLDCHKGPSCFQMKITPLTLPGAQRVHVIRIKNLTGAQWMYKELCTRLIPQFSL